MKAVGGKAINFLNFGALGFTVSDLAGMGVRRISVGGSLARVAMHAFIKSATRDRQGGQVRQLRRHHEQCRAQQVLRRRPQEPAMTVASEPLPRPASRSACRSPTRRPAPAPGRSRSKAATAGSSGWRQHHDAALWEAVQGHDAALDLYVRPTARLPISPRSPPGSAAALPLEDPYFYAVVEPSGRAVGIVSLMEIRPAMRVDRGRPHRLFAGPAAHAARHRGAVPAGALRVRDARLPPLRMEMQCAQRAVAARGGALRLRATKASCAST